MTDNLPTTDQCKAFTLAMGECWHEYEGKYKCSCGKIFCIGEDELVVEHLKLNPTYSHAASILEPMMEKLGESVFGRFIDGLGYVGTLDAIKLYCIFNPRSLIEKALDFMRKEKGE